MKVDQRKLRKVNAEMEGMIGKPFVSKDSDVRSCWAFCRQVGSLLGKGLGKSPKGLGQVRKAKMWSIVIFNFKYDWHAGIVWPDGLHFVHYDEEKGKVCKDRLTLPPWKSFIEGFYTW